MKDYTQIKKFLVENQFVWLVTGVAGFIGSNLMEALLSLNQKVVGLDNFATGYKHNIDQVLGTISPQYRNNFDFIEGDIRSMDICEQAMQRVDYVLHQAALGSVPRSIVDPLATHSVNVDGFLNILIAAKEQKVKRFVYASSSSVYGDSLALPKIEDNIGRQLSPYAVSKYANELYAGVFSKCYGTETIGLRYFNVFGRRQDPNGAYAAVMPIWIKAMLNGDNVLINGDGETTRDFCYIDNVVQANLLAVLAEDKSAVNTVYNVAVGEKISLNELVKSIRNVLEGECVSEIVYKDFRVGDIRHSLADISKARELLGYSPVYKVQDGLRLAINWYQNYFAKYIGVC